MVEMDVVIPDDADPDEVARARIEEREYALQLQRDGEWRHLWRVVGQARNVSIFDVASHARLHELLSGLPLRRWLDLRVTPLTTHPSALTED